MIILLLDTDKFFFILIGERAGEVLPNHLTSIANTVIERIVEYIGKIYKKRNGKSESKYQKKNTI